MRNTTEEQFVQGKTGPPPRRLKKRITVGSPAGVVATNTEKEWSLK
jgi:hypothetical protein